MFLYISFYKYSRRFVDEARANSSARAQKQTHKLDPIVSINFLIFTYSESLWQNL